MTLRVAVTPGILFDEAFRMGEQDVRGGTLGHFAPAVVCRDVPHHEVDAEEAELVILTSANCLDGARPEART